MPPLVGAATRTRAKDGAAVEVARMLWRSDVVANTHIVLTIEDVGGERHEAVLTQRSALLLASSLVLEVAQVGDRHVRT